MRLYATTQPGFLFIAVLAGVISMRDKQGKRGKRKITSSRRSHEFEKKLRRRYLTKNSWTMNS